MKGKLRLTALLAALAMFTSTMTPVYADQLSTDVSDIFVRLDDTEEEEDEDDTSEESADIALGYSVHLDEEDLYEDDKTTDGLFDVEYEYEIQRYSWNSSTKTINLLGELPDSGKELVFPDHNEAEHVNFSGSAYTTKKAEAMFHYLPKVVDIKNFSYLDTSAAETMEDMFFDDYALKSMDLTKFKTGNVTNMAGMFGNCRSLTSLDLSSFDTRKATDMSFMFSNCSSLKSIDMSGFTVSSSANTRSMFSGCTSITSIKLPAGFKVSQQMELPNEDDTYAGWAKAGTNRIISIGSDYATFTADTAGEYVRLKKSEIWSSWDESIGTLTVFGQLPDTNSENTLPVLAGVDPLAVKKVIIKKGTHTGESCYSMFSGMRNLVSVEGLEGLILHSATDARWMFSECSSLRSLDLSAFAPYATLSVKIMLADCTSLRTLVLPKGFIVDDTLLPCSDETYLGWAVQGSTHIISKSSIHSGTAMFTAKEAGTYVRITHEEAHSWYTWEPETGTLYLEGQLPYTEIDNTGKIKNLAYYANIDKNAIKTISIARGTTADISAQYMFADMANLTEINGLKDLDISKALYLNSMFSGCSKLSSLDLTGFNMKNVRMYSDMFKQCTSLHSLELREGFAVMIDMALPNVFGNSKGWTYAGQTGSSSISGSDIYAHFNAARTGEYIHTANWYTFNSSTGELVLKGLLPDTIYDSFSKKYRGLAYYAGIDAAKIKKITVSDGCTAGVSTSGMFMGMTALTEINGLDKLAMNDIRNASMMFYNCSSLSAIDLRTLRLTRDADMTAMFLGAKSLSSLRLPNGFMVQTHMHLDNISGEYTGWSEAGTAKIISGTSADAAVFTAKGNTEYVRLGKPKSPLITKTEPGNGKMTVYWSSVIGAEKYTVYYYMKGQPEKSVDRSAAQTSAYISGLPNGTYYVYVKAVVNGKRTTEKNIASTVLADYGIRCTAAQNGAGKINISWKNDTVWTGRSDVTKYRVVCTDENNNVLGTKETKTTSLNWAGLHNNTTYGFYVQPFVNGAYPTFIRTDAKDKEYITWTCPVNSPMITKLSLGNHKLWLYYESVPRATKYYIYVIQNDEEYLKGTTTNVKYLVTGLENDTPATFYVKALVDGKLTDRKRTATRTTRDGIKPALDISAGQCVISWNKYTDTNGTATKYKVVLVDENYKQIDFRETTNLKFTWKGLTTGTKYGFYVVPYVNDEYIPFGLSHADDKANVVMFTAG